MVEIGPFVLSDSGNSRDWRHPSGEFELCHRELLGWFDVVPNGGPVWLQFFQLPGNERLKILRIANIVMNDRIVVETRAQEEAMIFLDFTLVEEVLRHVALPIYVSVAQEMG